MYSGQIDHEEKTEYNPNPMEVPPDETYGANHLKATTYVQWPNWSQRKN